MHLRILHFETLGGARAVVYGKSTGMQLGAFCTGCAARGPLSQRFTTWAEAHAETCRAPHNYSQRNPA